jgi:hypothetical protein
VCLDLVPGCRQIVAVVAAALIRRGKRSSARGIAKLTDAGTCTVNRRAIANHHAA